MWLRVRNIPVTNEYDDMPKPSRVRRQAQTCVYFSRGRTHNFGIELLISFSEDVRLERR